VSDPGLGDGDADGQGNACDPCTNIGNGGAPVFVQKAQVMFQNLGAPLGDERLKVKGTVIVPAAPAVNPIAKGGRQVIVDAAGNTMLDALVPAGPLDPLSRAGWTVNAAATSWTYRNTSTPTAGITKVSLKKGALVGEYRFAVLGKDGAYVVDTGALPLRALVVIDDRRAGGVGWAVRGGGVPRGRRRRRRVGWRGVGPW
jgi:hypothetical protein